MLSSVCVWVAFSFAALYALLFTLALTGQHCAYTSPTLCRLVAYGMVAAAVALLLVGAAMASTLRLKPGAESVPLSELRAWAAPKLGPCAAAAAVVAMTPVVWAVAQSEGAHLGPRARPTPHRPKEV